MMSARRIWSERMQCWILEIDDASTDATVFTAWYTTASTLDSHREPLPFFLDPDQIRALTPEINWDQRVGARIRQFLEWGAIA